MYVHLWRKHEKTKDILELLEKDYSDYNDIKYKELLLSIYSVEKKEKEFFEVVKYLKAEKEDIKSDDYFRIIFYLNSGNIDEAKKILTELQTTESNELLKELKFLDDEVMVYSTLTDLTDDEFKSLKNGTLNKEILKNKDVNKLLINKVRATKDIDNVRKEALASLEKGRKKAKLEKLFSSWDGSNVALTKSIKESMNDPGSYKHNETRYKEIDDNTLFIITSFRGKNAFGGVVLNSCSAKQDIETELITEMNCE